MQPVPYIGVTSFMNEQQVRLALAHMKDPDRKLMVGVLASSKTLQGEKNKWVNRFPDVRDISNIFVADTHALNLIHYSTDDRATLDVQLGEMMALGGAHLDGFQLNIVWPNPIQLANVLSKKNLRIVLQVGSVAFQMVETNPVEVAKCLDEYAGLITDILFDLSGGHGRELDVALGMRVLQAVQDRHPNLGLGIAGGLCAETLHLIEPIRREFPHVNIDTEGKVRDSKPDPLNMDKVLRYLHTATDRFGHAS